MTRFACLVSLAALAWMPGAAAQSFEEDAWRYTASNPASDRPLYDTDWLERDPNDSDVLAELVDHIYPTHLAAADLDCVSDPPIDATQDFVDAVLARFTHAAGWLDEQGFAPIHTYARMEEYDREVDPETGDVTYRPAGETVNLVGCDPAIGYFGTMNTATPTSAHAIRFGRNAAELWEANRLAFRLTSVHEFMHVYPNNYAPAFAVTPPRDPQHWFSEGLPDAIAVRYVADTVGGYSNLLAHGDVGFWRPESERLSHRYSRRFYLARPYFIPLNLTAVGEDQDSSIYTGASDALIGAVTEKDYDDLGYVTNGFWIHVLERYLGDDPSVYHGLWQSIGEGDIDRLMQRTDEWLDQLHDPMAGIEHIFPQFLAEYEGWWEDRLDYPGMSEERWLDYGFNGCEEVELDYVNTAELLEVEVALNAARCIDVILTSPVAMLKPDVDIAAYVHGDPVIANHLYLGLARVRGADTVGGASHPDGIYGHDWSCYELVESGTVPPGGCLMNPEQGEIVWTGSGHAVTARTFNVTEVGNSGTNNVRLRFILSFVHSGNLEPGTHMTSRDVTVAVAPSYAELDDGSGGGPKIRARVQPEAGNRRRTTVVYGQRAGRGPLLTNRGGAAPGAADFSDIFTGNLAIPGMAGDGPVAEAMREANARSLAVVEEMPDGRVRTAGFLLEEPLEIGQTGQVEVIALYEENAGPIAAQDPDNPSQLYIDDHTDYTLRFRGQVNVCVIDVATLQRAAMGSRQVDPCVDGERRRFAVHGAVGFPGIVSGRAPFTRVSTPELEAYQQLRLSRIADRLGPAFGPGTTGGPDPSDVPVPGGPASSGAGGGATGHAPDSGAQCSAPIVTDEGACDCSCESFTCLQTRADANTVTPPEMRCAMQCTSAWMACARPDGG